MRKPYTEPRIVYSELLEPNAFTHCLESSGDDSCSGVIANWRRVEHV